MALAEDEQVVQAFPAHAAQKPLARRIGPRRADRRAQVLDPARGDRLIELLPVLGVVVADQVAGALAERRGLAQLLGHPGVGRVPRRVHVDHPSCGQLDDVLQRDGRIQNVELASRVGLSPSPCLRRVRLLEEAGVIERYVALVNAPKVGMGLTVFVRVWLTGQDAATVDRFTEANKQLPQGSSAT